MSHTPRRNRRVQRLARALADRDGIPYQSALTVVRNSLSIAELDTLETAEEFEPHAFLDLIPARKIVVADPYDPEPGVIPLGVLRLGTDEAEVIGLSNVELDRHMFFCGRTGSGKSEMMKWMIFGVAKSDYPLVVIDPHGALVDDVVGMLVTVCPERADDVLVVDLSDEGHPVSFNPLDVHSKLLIEPTVNAVMEMLDNHLSLTASYRPRASYHAEAALRALAEANLHMTDPSTKLTLTHLVKFFMDDSFRRLIMRFCTDAMALEMYSPEYGAYKTGPVLHAMPVMRAMDQITKSPNLSAVFASPENHLDLASMIGERKIVLIKLARFAHQRQVGQLVGSLMIPYLLSSMDEWGRKTDPVTGEVTGRGCRLFVDEAPTIMGPNSAAITLLAEARKWDLGMIFASQYLGQFDSSVMRAVLGNTATKVSLALDEEQAPKITRSILGRDSAGDAESLSSMPDYHMLANVLLPTDRGGRAPTGAFGAACLPPIEFRIEREQHQMMQRVIERSRSSLCNPRETIVDGYEQMTAGIVTDLTAQIKRRDDSDGIVRPEDASGSSDSDH